MELSIKSRKEAEELLISTKHGFDTLVSIGVEPGYPMEGYEDFKGKKILFKFYDLQGYHIYYPAPIKQDIERLVEFYRTLPEDANVLIHCAAGISRSTACAYILLCLTMGPGKEEEALVEIEKIRSALYPSRIIVQFGDELLDREGKMLFEVDQLYERINGKLWVP